MNEEKYVSFSKMINVDSFKNIKRERVKIFREIRFIDSLKFMQFGLEKLVKHLQNNQCKNIELYFGDQKLDLLLRKGVYPYDYMVSFEKLNAELLPPIAEFYSKLNDCDVSDENYIHAQKVWEEFGMKTMRYYHDHYLKTDVLLLADVFEITHSSRY